MCSGVNSFYCCISQRFPHETVHWLWQRKARELICIHRSCFTTVPKSSNSPGVGGEEGGKKGGLTGPSVHVPFGCSGSAGVICTSGGLGTSSISSEKSHRARLWTSSFGASGANPAFSVWSRWLPSWGLLVMHHHCQMFLGGFRGLQSLLPTSHTFLPSAFHNCLKCFVP